jgi:hypothetical protein
VTTKAIPSATLFIGVSVAQIQKTIRVMPDFPAGHAYLPGFSRLYEF